MPSPPSPPSSFLSKSSSPPPHPQNRCLFKLSEITNQLLNKDDEIRFRCLTYHRLGGESIVEAHCKKSCKAKDRPQLFEQAMQNLQLYPLVRLVDYLDFVTRILFCEIHCDGPYLEEYCALVNLHLKGNGSPEELEFLEALHEAYQLPRMVSIQGPNILDPLLSLPGDRSSQKQESKNMNSGKQPEVEMRCALAYMYGVVYIFQGKYLPSDFKGASSSKEIYLPPTPPSTPSFQRIRRQSNLLKQHAEISLAQEASVYTKSHTTDESKLSCICSTSSRVFDSRCLIHKTSYRLSTRSTSIHEQDILLPTTPTPSMKFSSSVSKTVSTTPQSNNSKPGEFNRFVSPRTPTTKLGKNEDRSIPVDVDRDIRKEMEKPVAKSGFIYILKAPKYLQEKYPDEPQRVKIGITTNVKARVAQLKKSCGIYDLEIIEDCESISPHHFYAKVEKLVHIELRNFNKELKCENGKCKTIAHREWFEVSEEVALETVQRWRRFILTDPWEKDGSLKQQWKNRLKPPHLSSPGRFEEDRDHEKRNSRWNQWLDEGIESISS